MRVPEQVPVRLRLVAAWLEMLIDISERAAVDQEFEKIAAANQATGVQVTA